MRIHSIIRLGVGVLILALTATTNVRAGYTITASANPNFQFLSPNPATNNAGMTLPGASVNVGLGSTGTYNNVNGTLSPGVNNQVSIGQLAIEIPAGTGTDSISNYTYFDYYITITNTQNHMQMAQYDVSGPIGGTVDASDPSAPFSNLFIGNDPNTGPIPPITLLAGDGSLFDLSNIGIMNGPFNAQDTVINDTLTLSIKVKSVPEPASLTLLGLGGLGALRLARRQRSRTPAGAQSA